MQKEFEVKVGDILVTPRSFEIPQYRNKAVTVIWAVEGGAGCIVVQTLTGHKIDCTVADFVTRKGLSKKAHRKSREAIPARKRYAIFARDGFRCQICGRTAQDGAVLELDHIVPYSKGGKTTKKNLRVLCRECNRGKGAL